MAIQWIWDTRATGHPPCPLWELPLNVVEEVRWALQIVNKPHEN